MKQISASAGGDPKTVQSPHTISSIARVLRREDVVVAAQIEREPVGKKKNT